MSQRKDKIRARPADNYDENGHEVWLISDEGTCGFDGGTQPICSCGWIGRHVENYNSFSGAMVYEQITRHMRKHKFTFRCSHEEAQGGFLVGARYWDVEVVFDHEPSLDEMKEKAYNLVKGHRLPTVYCGKMRLYHWASDNNFKPPAELAV